MGTGGGGSRRKSNNAGHVSVPRKRTVVGDGIASASASGGAGNGGGGNSGNGTAKPGIICRKFGLVHSTGSAQKVEVGMDVWGEFQDPKVRVYSDKFGLLGDAPAQEAKFFIEERERRGGGRLSGNILKKTNHEARVKLCIK